MSSDDPLSPVESATRNESLNREDDPAGCTERDLACGALWVLSAPSGAGKTTVIREMLRTYPEVAAGLVFSVSHTTRPPRPGEQDGRDYHFVDRSIFERMIGADAFLEWAEVHGRFYGTSRAEVASQRARGRDVLLDIDVQGAEQVRSLCPDSASVFILPPSFAVLEQRLRRRGNDSPEQIERRLHTARREVLCCETYDYVILNGEVNRASEALASVILSRRYRQERMRPAISRIIDDFRASAR